jgi:cytochrome c oxidase subunit II
MGAPGREDPAGAARHDGEAPTGGGEERKGGGEAGHIRRLLKMWIALSVICIALVFVLNPLIAPKSGSSVAGFANLTNLVFTALAVPVALFVWLFVAYSIVVFHDRTSKDASVEHLEDGPPLQAKPWHQIAWLAITGTLAIFLVGWGMFGFYKQTTDPPSSPLVVDVTGQQWLWTYSYPSLGAQSTMLELPLKRPVEFRVTSLDVLHGFMINGLGVAMDANPGVWVTAPTVTPTKLGSYTTRCIELCGLYHSYMWSQVKVVPSATFASWVAENGGHLGAKEGAGIR